MLQVGLEVEALLGERDHLARAAAVGEQVDGEVARRHGVAVRQRERPLDQVLELADVARPVVALEHLHRVDRDLAQRATSICSAVLLQEEVDQERDVLAPLAQRRQVDRDDVEAVVEVLAEVARRRSAARGRGWWRR